MYAWWQRPGHRATTRVAPTMRRLRKSVRAWWQRIGPVIGRPQAGVCIVAKAPSPGDHEHRYRATTRVAPTMRRLRQPVRVWWQRNVFFLRPEISRYVSFARRVLKAIDVSRFTLEVQLSFCS